MHVTHELLLAVLDGKMPRRVLEEIVIEHLSALCPICHEEIETFDWRKYRREVPHRSVYDPHIKRVADSVSRVTQIRKQELREAERWLAELQRMAPEDRRGKVDRAHKRFRGSAFANLLVEETRSSLPDDPWGSYLWADIAWVVQYHTSGLEEDAENLVRIMAYRGNALRVLGRLNDADADMRFARRKVEDNRVTDLSICAELDALESSLRRDQRHLHLAERLLYRATFLYRLLGEVELRARSEIQLGCVYYEQGELRKAVKSAESALKDMSLEEHPDLYLFARYNLARALTEVGEPQQGLAIVEEDEEQWTRRFDELMHLRVMWLRAEIALALGERDEAEQNFWVARDGFLAHGIGYDVALLSLQLSLLLLERGETERVKEIAREAFRIFASQNVHPDALASLKVFRDAALSERLTVEVVRKIKRSFRKIGLMPPEDKEPS